MGSFQLTGVRADRSGFASLLLEKQLMVICTYPKAIQLSYRSGVQYLANSTFNVFRATLLLSS